MEPIVYVSIKTHCTISNVVRTSQHVTLPKAIEAIEKQMIRSTLAEIHHRIGKTAEKPGIPVRTLQRRIKQYQLMK